MHTYKKETKTEKIRQGCGYRCGFSDFVDPDSVLGIRIQGEEN
jgi:hypothetical protein